jgi:hypothetical protein
MNTPMKLISILGVLLRWAFLGDDGGDPAGDASDLTQAGSGFPAISPGPAPLGSAIPR